MSIIATKTNLPDGMFVTAYDTTMNTRECLGQWFNNNYKNQITDSNVIINGKTVTVVIGNESKNFKKILRKLFFNIYIVLCFRISLERMNEMKE